MCGATVARATLGINVTLLLITFGVGWRSSRLSEARFTPPRTAVVDEDRGRSWDDARVIAAANGRAFVALLALGFCSAGVYGWLVVGSNGYAIGYVMSSVTRESPALVPLVLAYAPLEFAAIVLGSAVGQALFVAAVQRVILRRSVQMAWLIGPAAVALVLLILAALLEAEAMQQAGVALP